MIALGSRRPVILLFSSLSVLLIFTTISWRLGLHNEVMERIHPAPKQPPVQSATPTVSYPLPKPPKETHPPIVDNFPLAARAKSASDLPPIPSWNKPPNPHVPEKTPLLIGFTRNWRLLQQTVVSYITAGWPPEDIYVVDNTGTMDANARGKLTLQNPFYLDYHRLTKVFEVNVLTTPTLFTFAQLQNYFLYTAIQQDWKYYFWGHMDVLALTEETFEPFKSLYMRALDDLREVNTTASTPGHIPWAIHFFAYDRLSLVNRTAFEDVGGWDPQIGYYGTDCDMHERLVMYGFEIQDRGAGLIYDLADSLGDLEVLYRRADTGEDDQRVADKFGVEDKRASDKYAWLRDTLNSMQINKQKGGRNYWQGRQTGGQGEPYYRDADGFSWALGKTIDLGKRIMAEKWGHWGCDLRGSGLKAGDEWMMQHDGW